MRNRLIQGHDLLDLDVIWDTVTVDLPKLAEELQSILAMED